MGGGRRLGRGEGREPVAVINTFMEPLRSWREWHIGY